MMQHERDGIERIQRKQDFGMLHDRRNRRDRDHCEPHTHDRSEKAATRAVPRDCTANSASNITTVSATTYGSNAA